MQEDRIFLLSLLMAEMGVHSVAYAFPRVRIITTAVDKRINEEFHIIPGIGEGGVVLATGAAPYPAAPYPAAPGSAAGPCPHLALSPSPSGNFGDRYFGTDAPPACCESEAMDC